jgi:ferredoxin
MTAIVKVIAESTAGRTVEIDAPAGAALAELWETTDLPIPFSCRSASCGTCRIRVLEGADQLEPPAEDELYVLDAFDAVAPAIRLTCQARLAAGATRVRVRAVNDE